MHPVVHQWASCLEGPDSDDLNADKGILLAALVILLPHIQQCTDRFQKDLKQVPFDNILSHRRELFIELGSSVIRLPSMRRYVATFFGAMATALEEAIQNDPEAGTRCIANLRQRSCPSSRAQAPLHGHETEQYWLARRMRE